MLVLSYRLHISEWEVSINRYKKHINCSTINKVSIFANISLNTVFVSLTKCQQIDVYFPKLSEQKTSCLYL